MNTECVNAIAKAVLYEGYMLYPYRPSSVKNRQRFNFGVIYPRAWSEAQGGSDARTMQTECLVRGSLLSGVEVKVRFLQLVNRSVGKLTVPVATIHSGEMPEFQLVPVLKVNGQVFQHWQEAIEREVAIPVCNLDALAAAGFEWSFAFSASEAMETLVDASGQMVGVLIRKQESLSGTVELSAASVAEGVFRIKVHIKNLALLEPSQVDRDNALLRSLVSAHTVLGAVDAEFVSLLEPPDALRELSATCQNVGAWPVLVGEPGQRDTMLSSPIILYDYPQIAPESPGDLFDGTEIDEILALRIMTMTDEEKREMRQSDERARKILERTENLPLEQLMKLHGTLRELHPLGKETP